MPFVRTITGPLDQCIFCQWHTEGALEVRRRRGERAVPVWCGAGREDYFYSRMGCPCHLPFYVVEFDHGIDVQLFSGSVVEQALRSDIMEWAIEMFPNIRIEETSAGVDISFPKASDYAMFKLRWL